MHACARVSVCASADATDAAAARPCADKAAYSGRERRTASLFLFYSSHFSSPSLLSYLLCMCALCVADVRAKTVNCVCGQHKHALQQREPDAGRKQTKEESAREREAVRGWQPKGRRRRRRHCSRSHTHTLAYRETMRETGNFCTSRARSLASLSRPCVCSGLQPVISGSRQGKGTCMRDARQLALTSCPRSSTRRSLRVRQATASGHIQLNVQAQGMGWATSADDHRPPDGHQLKGCLSAFLTRHTKRLL